MTHTCSHLEHNHAPPLLPRGICETYARELKPLDHGLNLRRRRFALSRQAGGGGGGGGGGGECLAPRKSLKFRLKSPITDPEEILSVEIFITVFAEKRTFIKDWIVCA